jgi:S1-C subfamily serine protease
MRALASALIVLAIVCASLPVRTVTGADALPPEVVTAFGSVVSVRVRQVVKVPVYRGGRFKRERVEGLGAGSGVVVSEDGLILTNAHVVAGSTEVRVGVTGGREIAAQVVSLDEASDLALLRAPGSGLRPLRFAEQGIPASGTEVFVLGNRADLGAEVSRARIGAHRHVRVGVRPLEFWCEVEAPIGPGNSGGALLDASGRLLGIPSLLISYAEPWSRPASRASGLFIPAEQVRRSMQKMTEGPRPVWPWIGLLMEDPLMTASEGRTWVEDAGLLVRSVFPGSPAAEAGFRPGDRIVSVATKKTSDNFQALDAVLDFVPGQTFVVEIERAGSLAALIVTAGIRPDDPRPDPLDDFTLHTGLRLQISPPAKEDRMTVAFAGMSSPARRDMPELEAALFEEGPVLGSILPGQSVLAGRAKRVPVGSVRDLGLVLPQCFVEEQFVAMAHWSFQDRKSVDRAYIHRKIYPFVL